MVVRVAHTNEALKTPSFVWLSNVKVPANATPVDAAWTTLRTLKKTLKLSDAAVANANVASVHDLGRGPIITRFAQNLEGVPVFGVGLNVTMRRDRTPVGLTGSLAPSMKRLSQKGWTASARDAIAAAFKKMTGLTADAGSFAAVRAADRAGYERYAFSTRAADGVRFTRARTRKVWYPRAKGLEPAWYVELEVANDKNTNAKAFSFVVQANDKSVLFSHNLVASDAYSYRVWADGSGPHGYAPLDSPYGNGLTPNATGAFDPNAIAPPYVFPSLVTLANSPFSKNDPWLPPGATELSGNNVIAYADLVAPDHFGAGDVNVPPTSPGVFDRIWDPTTLPAASTSNIQAVTTNLFFTINYMHDLFYDSGYDEASGNAQVNNYTRGGQENDPVLAESQDYSGIDNANCRTPSDGQSPTIQMYLWDYVIDKHVIINTPTPVKTLTQVATSVFGPQTFNVTNDVVAYVDAVGGANLACGDPANPSPSGTAGDAANAANAAALAGKFALVDRGVCDFTVKADNARAAGAVGIIVANAADRDMLQSFGDTNYTTLDTFPGMMVTYDDGQTLHGVLAGGGTLNITMFKGPPNRDGSVDGTIMSHEWGHSLSNRLIGDANGLDNEQGGGMGEGWSDFVALLTYVRPTDVNIASNANWNGVYPMGTYALGGTPNDIYYGIRRYPYSWDMTKDPLSFRHIQEGEPLPDNPPPAFGQDGQGNSEVHNVGEIWASTLWDCYVGLLRDTADYPDFASASQAMRDYLVASLKQTPNSPTILEARDAVLLTALANTAKPNDFTTFAKAFARRGMGSGAVGPDRASVDLTGVTESTWDGANIEMVDVSLDADTGTCDSDHELDNGETGTLTIQVRNNGFTQLTDATVKLSSTNAHVSFPDGATIALPAMAPYDTAQVTAKVTFNGATGPEQYDLKIDVDAANLGPTPGPRSTTLTAWGNFDWAQSGSTTDNADDPNTPWVITDDGNLDTSTSWQLLPQDGTFDGSMFYGPGVDATADEYLISPALDVGAGGATMTFKHAWAFEYYIRPDDNKPFFFDGGVLEVSTDGGMTWTALDNELSGEKYVGTIYDGSDPDMGSDNNPLGGRNAFVAVSPNFPSLVTTTVDLSAFADKTIEIRFRLGSDLGFPSTGWIVDDIAFTGITNMPFPKRGPQGGSCHAPMANAGTNQTVNEGAMVTLDGSGSSDADSDPLTYAWTQVAGPAVTLSDAAAAKPTFTAPAVDADTTLQFQLVVSDGKLVSLPATVTITVKDVPPPGDMAMGGGGGNGDMATGGGGGSDDMATGGSGGSDDMATGGGSGGGDDMAQTPAPPDMSKGKGGKHGGCSATGGGAPASALPLVGLALLALALRRRYI